MMNTTHVSDLTVEELVALLRKEMRDLIYAAVREALEETGAAKAKRSPLEIPPLDVGPWPEGLQLISREEYYGDEGR